LYVFCSFWRFLFYFLFLASDIMPLEILLSTFDVGLCWTDVRASKASDFQQ
jgi:hypothetical protein